MIVWHLHKLSVHPGNKKYNFTCAHLELLNLGFFYSTYVFILTLIWFLSCSASWRNWSSSLILLLFFFLFQLPYSNYHTWSVKGERSTLNHLYQSFLISLIFMLKWTQTIQTVFLLDHFTVSFSQLCSPGAPFCSTVIFYLNVATVVLTHTLDCQTNPVRGWPLIWKLPLSCWPQSTSYSEFYWSISYL